MFQDSGGSLAPYVYVEDFPKFQPDGSSGLSTSAAECMRQHLTDSIEFLADFHSLSKIKVWLYVILADCFSRLSNKTL